PVRRPRPATGFPLMRTPNYREKRQGHSVPADRHPQLGLEDGLPLAAGPSTKRYIRPPVVTIAVAIRRPRASQPSGRVSRQPDRRRCVQLPGLRCPAPRDGLLRELRRTATARLRRRLGERRSGDDCGRPLCCAAPSTFFLLAYDTATKIAETDET